MSKEFIKARFGEDQIAIAAKQQKNLAYLTRSNVQEEINGEMLDRMCEGKYGDDPLLSWVFMLFRKDNFRSFAKYLRFPLPSSRIIENEVVPQLERVFFSEDGFENYDVAGEDKRPDDVEEFTKIAFDALLYRYNDIIIHDLDDINSPFRSLINIDRVVSLISNHGVIERMAYMAAITTETGEVVEGFVYMDDKEFSFYDKDFKYDPIVVPHDLGECPADYVSSVAFNDDNDIVRSSVFSRSRELMEEYVFTNTLRKMTDPNGAIPIVVKLASQEEDFEGEESVSDGSPMSADALIGARDKKSSGDLETGTVVDVPILMKDNGEVDTAVAEKYLNFFRTPVDSLEYLDKRIKQIKDDIIISIIGDHGEVNEEAKNKLQVSKTFVSKQDRLRKFATGLTSIRNRSDFKMLALEHGKERVTVDMSFGTDFFIETQEEIFTMLNQSPNPIERATLINRLTANRGRGNVARIQRDAILYRLLPFATDKEFKEAMTIGAVDEDQIQFQLRMQYFIGIFEATYGDIVVFWEILGEMEESRKLVVINKLIIQIIKEHGIEKGFSSKDESVSPDQR